MRILISNDDGYQAPGIICLAGALTDALGDAAEIIVVAPDRNRSGASNSLTLDNPIRATRMANGFICVDGTPTDCVHLAVTGLLDKEPDMVIAGINAGANLGDDVLYSGTVAAAVEGRFLGAPAMALSLVGDHMQHYATAAQVACELVGRLQRHPLPADTILNVNVPDLPYAALSGMQATRLGHRHRSEPVYRTQDPRGREIYWVGPPGEGQDAGPGTDFYAIAENAVSITPLQIDMTSYQAIDSVASWLQEGDA